MEPGPLKPVDSSQPGAPEPIRKKLESAGGSAPITRISADLLRLIISYLSEDERTTPREIASWFRDNIAKPHKLTGTSPDNPAQLKASHISQRVLGAAAGLGAIPFLDWAKARQVPMGEYVTNEAASAGKLDVLKWAVQNDCPIDLEYCVYNSIQNGHLDVLQWLQKDRGYRLQEHDMDDAVTSGQLEMLKWLRDQLKNQGISLNKSQFNAAVSKGIIPVMEWLHEQECPWDEEACLLAAHNGQLEALRWLRAHGCPWNEGTCWEATNKIPVLEWAINNGVPFRRQDLLKSALPEVKRWLEENTVAYEQQPAVDKPETEFDKQSVENRNIVAKETADLEKNLTPADLQRLAAQLPKNVSANLPPPSDQYYFSSLMSELARYGSVHNLQWMMERNFPPPKSWFCTSAAGAGNLEALKWARAHDYPWQDTAIAAADNGRLELLQWAIANDCPWDKQVCYVAAQQGRFNLLKWALANSAPYDREQLIKSAANYPEMRVWLEINLPRPKQP